MKLTFPALCGVDMGAIDTAAGQKELIAMNEISDHQGENTP